MTPQPNAPPSQPSWFSKNCMWLAGGGCLLAVMCCGLVGVVGWLTASQLPPVPEIDAPQKREAERLPTREADGPPTREADEAPMRDTADAAQVDCGTPGPDGVDCDVQRTGGTGSLLACWTLEITCANQGVMVGNLLWVSGNVGQDPVTGKVSPDFAVEARQAITNIAAILKAADLSLADVVKTNVYVTDVAKYEAFNNIYVEMMPKPLPARTFVGVAALPSGAQIEIEVIAARK